MPDDAGTFVLVGHCLPDRFLIKRAVRSAVPGADVVNSNDARSLERVLSDADGPVALLVNRVLDGRFTGESGLELIRELRERCGENARAVLISDRAEAQREAETLGAEPGVGKSDLHSDEAQRRLRAALGRA